MQGPYYLVECDSPVLLVGGPGVSLLWGDIQRIVNEDADLFWDNQGEVRVLKRNTIQDLWAAYQARGELTRLDRAAAMPPVHGFTWGQTVPAPMVKSGP